MTEKEYQKIWRENHKEYIHQYNKEYRKKHPEYFREYYKKYFKDNPEKQTSNTFEYQLEYRTRTPENNKKYKVRLKVADLIRKGKIKRQICEIEKCNLLGEAHHENYDKPLDLRWLCKNHHEKYHSIIKKKSI